MIAARRVARRLLATGVLDLEAQRELLGLYGLAPAGSRGSVEAVELAVELVRDDSVGASLRVSYAGAGAELLHDEVTLLLPAARGDVAAALRRLAVWPRLCGEDGGSRFDVTALERAVSAVGLLGAEVPHVAGARLEPVRVLEHGVVVGSATLRLAPEASYDDGSLRVLA